mmetsp:Transcript_21799/g.36143  ORF Transcript_21799/g.36143 Transcript_21799/m.36143 type:complete len:119 (-) Transcript_21799:48-404(-)
MRGLRDWIFKPRRMLRSRVEDSNNDPVGIRRRCRGQETTLSGQGQADSAALAATSALRIIAVHTTPAAAALLVTGLCLLARAAPSLCTVAQRRRARSGRTHVAACRAATVILTPQSLA